MAAVSYLASVASVGIIAGVGPGSSLVDIQESLGYGCILDRRKKSLRVDYGLLEFNLYEGICESVAIQIHRLSGGHDRLVPNSLLEPLADIGRRVEFEDLRFHIEADSALRLEEISGQSGYRCYRVGKSHTLLYVFEGSSAGVGSLRGGDLWSIVISKAG